MRDKKNTENGIKGVRNEGRMDAAGEGDDIFRVYKHWRPVCLTRTVCVYSATQVANS
jgi:hypothetical protein